MDFHISPILLVMKGKYSNTKDATGTKVFERNLFSPKYLSLSSGGGRNLGVCGFAAHSQIAVLL
jgi:hypothetical protein